MILSKTFFLVTLLAAGAAVTTSTITAQETQDAAPAITVDEAAIHEIVTELADDLEANFLFPDKASAYAEMLRANLGAGAYGELTNADALAARLTEDLQAIHPDGHLRVFAPQPPREGGEPRRRGPFGPESNAISKMGWLDDGVAYIRFEGFPGNAATMAALESFLQDYRDAKTLIIDARTHRGGGLDEMDMMFPHLFAAPTDLVAMETRAAAAERGGNPFAEASARPMESPDTVIRFMHEVSQPVASPLAQADVILLTSRYTGSAGEHLSLTLKRTGRAKLIGETTYGAGHYGGRSPLGHGFSAFVPVGRTYDPDTGEGWEGTGVSPHVAVPAEEALAKALELIGSSVDAKAAIDALG